MRKIASLLLIIASVMCLCACKKDITERGSDSYVSAGDFAGQEIMHLAESASFEAENYYDIYSYYEDYLYFLIRDEKSDYTNEVFKLIKYNLKTEETTDAFDVLFEENEEYMLGSISDLYVTADEIMMYGYVMDKSKDIETSDFNFAKITYDTDGNKKSVVLFEEDEKLALIKRCVADEEGNSYILTEPYMEVGSNTEPDFKLYLMKYDSQGKIVCVQQMKDYMDDIVQCNGRIILQRTGENNELGYYDVETDAYEPSQFKDMYPFQEYCRLVGTYNQNTLIMSDNYLYSFNCENNELKVLIDLKGDYIDINSVRAVEQISDDEVIFIYSADGYGYEIMHFDTKSNNDNSEKISVKVAAIGCSDADFVQTINDYSRHNNKYVIDFTDYEPGSDAYVNLLKDIVNGNEPDIFIVNGMDYENLVAKNMLEDLKPYLQKDDVLNEDFFIDGYLDAVTEDGKQYILSKSITLDVLTGKADEVGRYKDGWTPDDIIDYYGQKKGAYLFSSESAFDIFKRLFTGNIDCFVDWKNGECSFDGEEFKKLLGFCKVVSNVECPVLNGTEKYKAVQDGELLFLSDEITGIENIQVRDAVLGDNAAYIGYPSVSDNGIYMRSQLSTFAISSACENKEAAWAAIKELMTGDYSKYNYTASLNLEIPVSKKDFEKMERFYISTEEYTDEDGELVKPIGGGIYDGIEVQKPVKEQFDLLKDLIRKAKYSNSDSSITDIIEEDIYDYITGAKDLDKTVDIIQDKMRKYVNENR